MVLTNNGAAGNGPILVSQSYAPVSRNSDNATDATITTLATIVIPGGLMNLNGRLEIVHDWFTSDSAIVKTIGIKWGGTSANEQQFSTPNVRGQFRFQLMNTDSYIAQNFFNSSTYGKTTVNNTAAVDIRNNANLEFFAKWASNTPSEFIRLLGYSVWYYPGNT